MTPPDTFEARDLLKIVSHRENIITIYLMAIVVALLCKIVQDQQALLFVQLLIWTGTGTAFLMLALALKEKHAWWAFVAAFIPLVNLYMVFRLRLKATSVLRNHGVTISTAFKMRKEIRRKAS
jgi:hypothetical protein